VFLNGKIAGFSGILLRAVGGGDLDLAFLISMGLAGSLALGAPPPPPPAAAAAGAALAAAALGGAISGAGFASASGCTSGHGVCGLGRASPRSLAAVATFMATGALAASLAPHFGGALARAGRALGGGGALGPLLALAPAALRPAVPLAALLLAGAAVVACGGGGGGGGGAPRPAPARARASGAQLAASAACGALFGVGLAVSGMADPAVVKAFLNPWAPGGWNPRLAAVMGGAVAVTAPAFFLMSRRAAPPALAPEAGPLANAFAYGAAGPNKVVNARLLLGAAAFGLGWGLGGVCPGPGVVAACAGSEAAFAAVLSSIASALVWQRLWG
jgi:uncharacterized membrane protein YedE/YeeE